MKAIDMIINCHLPYINIISKCKLLMEELGNPTLQHVYMEQSRVVDVLAREGAKVGRQQGEAVVLGITPMFVRDMLRADIERTFFVRSKACCNRLFHGHTTAQTSSMGNAPSSSVVLNYP